MEENEDESDVEDVYIEMFGDHKKKDTRIGNSYQVSSVPLITDI